MCLCIETEIQIKREYKYFDANMVEQLSYQTYTKLLKTVISIFFKPIVHISFNVWEENVLHYLGLGLFKIWMKKYIYRLKR